MIDHTIQYTIKDLAKYWKCSEIYIYNLLRAGELTHLRIGKLIRIPVNFIIEYELNQNRKKQSIENSAIEKKRMTNNMIEFYHKLKKVV
ncbi:MAG: helix-turn-helix domain-containing protein [Emcibacteraceae bacterium]|nr:helix-turn-helix domain-containing protein [Emcibacteraceae bacterium]